MLRNSILEIFNHTWPMIIICTVILSSMRIIYIIKNKEHSETIKKEVRHLAELINDENIITSDIIINKITKLGFGAEEYVEELLLIFLKLGSVLAAFNAVSICLLRARFS